MADQNARQDENQFPGLLLHTGTAGTAETIRAVADSSGNLMVNIAAGETINIGTLNLGTIDLVKSGTVSIDSIVPGTGVTNLGKEYGQTATADDVGIAVLGKVLSSDSHDSNNNDGNYGRLSLTDFRELRTRDQRAIDIANCNGGTADYTALSNDTTNIGVSANHVFGTAALTFDKANGTDNTIYGGVSKNLGTVNISEIFEAGGFIGCSVYLPALTNVVGVFLRIGTDANNYNCWFWPVASLTAAVWLNLRQPASVPDYSRNAGAGWNPTALKYAAFGVEFSSETNTLAGILFDHVHVVGGRVTATDLSTAVTTTVNNPNINIQKIGNNIVSVNNGTADSGVLRVTLASDSTGKIAVGTINSGTISTIGTLPNIPGGTIGVVSSLTTGSVVVTAGTVTTSMGDLSGGTIDIIAGGSIVVTAGTVTTSMGDLSGGTIDLISDGTLVTKMASGTLNVGTITVLPNIPGGTLGVVSSVTNLASGTLAVLSSLTAGTVAVGIGTVAAGTINAGTITAGTINAGTITAGTIDLLKTGTIAAVTSVTNLVSGTLAAVTSVTNLASGTLAVVSSLTNGSVVVTAGTIAALVPGTAATNLGKAEDNGHSSGDIGVMALGVRNDTPNAAIAGADADYIPIATYKTGAIRTIPCEEDFAVLGSNHVKKYYTSAGAATDGIIWSPAAGKRWYVTDIFIQVSAAATVTLEDDLAGGDAAIWKAELAANSGWSHSFATPWFSGEDAADLIITTSAGNVYVMVTGYEI